MASNGRGSIRTNGRSPPFLAIGLFVALVILGFNYWTLSARNGEQANEIALMESELRLVNSKKVSAEKRTEALSDKVKDLEDELENHKHSIAKNTEELNGMKTEKEELENIRKELEQDNKAFRDERLPSCEESKRQVEAELNLKIGELQNVQKMYDEKQTECGEAQCINFIKDTRDATLKEIYKAAGTQPLVALYQKGGNLGGFREVIENAIQQQMGQQQQQAAGNENVVQQDQNQPPQQLTQTEKPVEQPEQPAGNIEQPEQPAGNIENDTPAATNNDGQPDQTQSGAEEPNKAKEDEQPTADSQQGDTQSPVDPANQTEDDGAQDFPPPDAGEDNYNDADDNNKDLNDNEFKEDDGLDPTPDENENDEGLINEMQQ